MACRVQVAIRFCSNTTTAHNPNNGSGDKLISLHGIPPTITMPQLIAAALQQLGMSSNSIHEESQHQYTLSYGHRVLYSSNKPSTVAKEHQDDLQLRFCQLPMNAKLLLLITKKIAKNNHEAHEAATDDTALSLHASATNQNMPKPSSLQQQQESQGKSIVASQDLPSDLLPTSHGAMSTPMLIAPMTPVPLPDDACAYELTPKEASAALASLQARTTSLIDAPLQTHTMRAKAQAAAKHTTPTPTITHLRIKLPNNLMVQGTFSSTATLADVKEWLLLEVLDELPLMRLDDFELDAYHEKGSLAATASKPLSTSSPHDDSLHCSTLLALGYAPSAILHFRLIGKKQQASAIKLKANIPFQQSSHAQQQKDTATATAIPESKAQSLLSKLMPKKK